jgi:hypothetical protein
MATIEAYVKRWYERIGHDGGLVIRPMRGDVYQLSWRPNSLGCTKEIPIGVPKVCLGTPQGIERHLDLVLPEVHRAISEVGEILPGESGHLGPFGKLAYSRIDKQWVPCHLHDGKWSAIPRPLLPGETRFIELMSKLEGMTKNQLMRRAVMLEADYEGMCGREDDSDDFNRFVTDIVMKLWEEK